LEKNHKSKLEEYKIKNRRRGFTLVEVLVAMSIISLIAIGFFTILNTSIRFNVKNEKDIKALNIAQSEIENLRNQIKSKKKDFTTVDGKEINTNKYPIHYDKIIGEDKTSYNVNLKLDEKNNLYTISIDVELNNTYFSKRSLNLITQVFGN
jgi:prepilin-type N-terminal cleavage/methylation domain-containing protein